MSGQALCPATVTALLTRKAAQASPACYLWHKLPIKMDRSGAPSYTTWESAPAGLAQAAHYWDNRFSSSLPLGPFLRHYSLLLPIFFATYWQVIPRGCEDLSSEAFFPTSSFILSPAPVLGSAHICHPACFSFYDWKGNKEIMYFPLTPAQPVVDIVYTDVMLPRRKLLRGQS